MEDKLFRKEVDGLTAGLDSDFSHLKSTSKGFIAFFEKYCKISKEFAESLLTLSRDGGDYISLKEPLTKCLGFESSTMKHLIKELLEYTASISEFYLSSAKEIESKIINGFSLVYRELKDQKENHMQAVAKRMEAYEQAGTSGERVTAQKELLEMAMVILDKQVDLESYRVGSTVEKVV
jgi:hypothetical protein